MLRVPIWRMSAYSDTSGTVSDDITSVITGIPVRSASARILSPPRPCPWKLYGEVRGLKAPPRRMVAPAFWAWMAASISRSLLHRARPRQ